MPDSRRQSRLQRPGLTDLRGAARRHRRAKLVYGYPIVWSKTSAVLTASIEEFVVTVDHQSLTDRRTSDAAIAGAPPRERPSLVREGRTEMMRWLSP
jgi:hypothetical protein